MDIPNAGNYKYYRCRSLLTCDTGGTVYDTSKTYDEPAHNTSLQCYSDGSQSENIVYVIDTEKETKKENKLLVDLTTHLDDDEFNDYEIHSNLSCEPKSEIVQRTPGVDETEHLNLKEPEFCQVEDFDCYFLENEVNQNVQHIVNQIINNDDAFAVEGSQYSQNDSNLNNTIYPSKMDSGARKYPSSMDRNNVCEQEDLNFQYSFNSSQNSTDSFNSNNSVRPDINEYEYDSSIKIGTESNIRHNHKRKQTYNVKDDSFTELLDVHKDVLCKSMAINNKSKKKKSAYNKENHREKCHYLKRNPFANLKMNSILKGNKKQVVKKDKDNFVQERRESMTSSNDENFGQSNYNHSNSSDKVLTHKRSTYQIDYVSFFNSRGDVLQTFNTVIAFNSEFSDANYLEYVQPREQIVESNMDKLLSPTVEVDYSEVLKTCKVKPVIQEKEMQVDYNGNDVHFQDVQNKSNLKSALTPNEIAERELFLKSAYAKKLGFENYFNTSNDSVINEILFEQTVSDIENELKINIIKKVDTQSKQNLLLDKSFKPVSCTLLESLNEFNRFGGFIEENSKEETLNHAEEPEIVIINEGPVHLSRKDEFQKANTNNSNLPGLNLQSKYDYCNSLEYLTGPDDSKRSFASLKIKIKRINDENGYVIDDSNRQNIDLNVKEKKIINSAKSIDRYECYDCSEKFRTKRILKNHVSENHKGPYDAECEICHMKFRRSSAHKKHQPWCQKNITYKCDICHKVYCYQASLVKHLKTHNKILEINLS